MAGDDFIAAMLGYEHRARKLRNETFDAAVINDSSWPLLQDLLAAHLKGQKLRTKQLCAASGLPQTTVLRYLDHLERFGVVRRESDPGDSRVTLVSVTEAGALRMREYYTRLLAIERQLGRSEEGLFSLRAPAENAGAKN
uniref:MarR family winged helix-turn-helix transcriptional regulator n=1 Tax=Altererythrobacter segetis TaxID=1104773 RepID=UPI00140B80C4|nr:winged helix DNA-binding protein [Altererythrobacter segetis]